MSARIKKLDPPVKSVILSNYPLVSLDVHRANMPTCNVHAMKNPVSCHAMVINSVITRLY